MSDRPKGLSAMHTASRLFSSSFPLATGSAKWTLFSSWKQMSHLPPEPWQHHFEKGLEDSVALTYGSLRESQCLASLDKP